MLFQLQKLNHFEMDVHFIGEEDKSHRTTLVAKYEEETADSDVPLIHGSLKKTKTHLTPREKEQLQNKTFRHTFARQLAFTLTGVAGECIGTFFLTLVICSVVTASVIMSAHVGLWQVAIVCGLGVSVSIYCTAHLSEAHLNPAITLAFAIVRWRTFSWKKIVPYIIFQLFGGVLAGAVTYGLFQSSIAYFEAEHDIERGSNNSALTAMLFGEYFPNPAVYDHSLPESYNVISPLGAMAVEAFCTGILAFVIFSLTDKQNSTISGGTGQVTVPILIGLTVSLLISICGPLTQVGMNPARDFGPRIFAACAGWGKMAIPGPRNGFWIYILGPILGAVVGAGLNDWIFSNAVRLSRKFKESSGTVTNVAEKDTHQCQDSK